MASQVERFYVVATWVPRAQTISIGALGPVVLHRGWYAYVGSARRGRFARVARHMRADKPLRWHADYLFSRYPATQAWLIDAAAGHSECALAEALAAACDAASAAAGSATAADGLARGGAPAFGASDCGCPGHLVFCRTQAGLRAAAASAAAALNAHVNRVSVNARADRI